MSTEPHSSPPEARPPGSRRRSVVALLALLVLGLGLTLWLTRPGVAPIIPLDAALATPGANPQTSDLYAPPQLPATSGQPSTPLPTVAPLTQATASAAAASREQPTALPASPTSLPSGTPVADAFAQAVAGPATPDDRPAPVGRTAGMAAQVQPPIGPGSLTSTWAGSTVVGGGNSSLVGLGGLTETSPIGLTSPLAVQSASQVSTIPANVQVAAALNVPDHTSLPALLALVGALLLTARRRLGGV